MEISKAAVGMLGGLCLALGAGGAYIATRGAESPAVVTAAPEAGTISPDPTQGIGVEQSEAIVTDSATEPAPAPESAPAPRVAPRPVERRAPAARPQARAPRQPIVEDEPTLPPVVEERVAVAPALEPAPFPNRNLCALRAACAAIRGTDCLGRLRDRVPGRHGADERARTRGGSGRGPCHPRCARRRPRGDSGGREGCGRGDGGRARRSPAGSRAPRDTFHVDRAG